MNQLLAYVSVVSLCALKFMVGVAAGVVSGLSLLELFVCYVTGGCIGVVVYAFLGTAIASFIALLRKRPEAETKPAPAWVQHIWQRYGLLGLALIAPPTLGPPVAVPLAILLGAPRPRVIAYMCISVVLWSAVFAYSGQAVIQYIHL